MEKSREAYKEEQLQHLHTAVFAIIIGVLMACLERAAVVSLVEQWRARIFLLLNLILLTVLFTSFHCSGSNPCPGVFAQKTSAHEGRDKNASDETGTNEVEICEEEVKVELSEEELNQRVEAFIAMFRQHLVSDCRRKTRISPPKTV